MTQDLSQLQAYRGAHAGATIIVSGCGPSVQPFIEYSHLFITIGVNDVARFFHPTYLVMVDGQNRFKGDRWDVICGTRCRAYFTQLGERNLTVPGLTRVPITLARSKQARTTAWSDGAIGYNNNSPHVACCLAAYMGASRIGLVGVDITDAHSLSQQLKTVDKGYAELHTALSRSGVELWNLGGDLSQVTTLPKAPLLDFIKHQERDAGGRVPPAPPPSTPHQETD